MSGRVELDLAWRMHDSAAQAIDKADTKAGFAATVETAVAAVVLTLVSQSHSAPLAERVLFGLALVALAVALSSALLVVPQLHRPAAGMAFLYFGAARSRSVEQLHNDIAPTSPSGKVADPLDAVTHQAKCLAGIAWAKHRWLRVSFVAVAAGAVFAVAGVLIGGAR